MDIKRFVTDDVREGMLSVRSLLGPDAVILSNRRIGNRIEILATNEIDAESIDVRTPKKRRAEVEVSDFGESAIRDKHRGFETSSQTVRSVSNAEVDLDAAAFARRQADQYQAFTPQSLVPSTDTAAATPRDLTPEASQDTALSPAALSPAALSPAALSQVEEALSHQHDASQNAASASWIAASNQDGGASAAPEDCAQAAADTQEIESAQGQGLLGLWRAARQSLTANRGEQAAEESIEQTDPSSQVKIRDNQITSEVGTESAGSDTGNEGADASISTAQAQTESVSAFNLSGEALPQMRSELTGHRQEAAVPLLGAAQRLTGLGQELGELKTLLRKELTRLRSLQGRELPFETHCKEVLMEMGFSAQAIEQVIEALADERESASASLGEGASVGACQRVHDALARSIQVIDRDLIGAGGVFSMIGASGVGKTTTVAKLAARYSLLHGRSSIGLITTDAFKIGGQDQLATFGKLLGIAVHAAHDEDQLTDALKRNMDKQLVLIDSAGMSARDARMNRHLARIKMHGTFAKNILIASATSQPGLADVVLEEYAHASVHGAVLTKVDEAVNLGPGLSTLVQKAVPLAYSCDGQGLADIQVAHVTSLLKEAFARVREARDIEFESHEVQQQHA
jgi:flagellar biosynthesis protein FlhF